MVEIAKEMMGTNDSDLAVKLFRQKLNSTESFFNDAPIPKNESNKEAHRRCSNFTGAEKYCPKRWAAMQLWFREARRVSKYMKMEREDLSYLTSRCHLISSTCRQFSVALRSSLRHFFFGKVWQESESKMATMFDYL